MASATEPISAVPRAARGPARAIEGHAFGLALHSALPVDGIEGSLAGMNGQSPTVIELAHEDELTAGWTSGDGLERLEEWFFDDGTPQGSLHRHPALGYRLSARPYGTYVVCPRGDTIRCAPPPDEERWRWQRCLIGQILPLSAALRGMEVFHSSALSVGNVAFGLVGASKAGAIAGVSLRPRSGARSPTSTKGSPP